MIEGSIRPPAPGNLPHRLRKNPRVSTTLSGPLRTPSKTARHVIRHSWKETGERSYGIAAVVGSMPSHATKAPLPYAAAATNAPSNSISNPAVTQRLTVTRDLNDPIVNKAREVTPIESPNRTSGAPSTT